MNHLRQKSISLRLKGFSYNEINRGLHIPKSTLSNWLSDIVLPDKAKERIAGRVSQGVLNGLIKRNKAQTAIALGRAEKIKKDAKSEIVSFSKRDLLLIGTALYWAEGYKRVKVVKGVEKVNHSISLTNSDPDIIRLFISFLLNVLDVQIEKISVDIRMFEHQKEADVLLYWQRITGLPKSQFNKPQYPISKSSMGKRPFNRLPFGTIQIRVGDTPKFYKIMGWIEALRNLANFVKKA